jgi:hypothetical protein
MISKAVTRKRNRSKSRTRVAPAQLDSHYRDVSARKRVAKLGPRKHYGMGKKARAERRAIRDATRGYKLRSAYGSKRRGRKSRRGRKGRKTRRRGKRRTKSKK